MAVEIKVNDEPMCFLAGDAIDLGAGGLIVWFCGDEAEGVRSFQRARTKLMNRIVAKMSEKTQDAG